MTIILQTEASENSPHTGPRKGGHWESSQVNGPLSQLSLSRRGRSTGRGEKGCLWMDTADISECGCLGLTFLPNPAQQGPGSLLQSKRRTRRRCTPSVAYSGSTTRRCAASAPAEAGDKALRHPAPQAPRCGRLAPRTTDTLYTSGLRRGS